VKAVTLAALLGTGCAYAGSGGGQALARGVGVLAAGAGEGQKPERPSVNTKPTQVSREAATFDDLPSRLAHVWQDDALPFERRRERLFEIWDESQGDPGGDEARRAVIGFVLENVPFGSVFGYTEGELERLNARRRSKVLFDPYDTLQRVPAAAPVPAKRRPPPILTPLPLPKSVTQGVEDAPVPGRGDNRP